MNVRQTLLLLELARSPPEFACLDTVLFFELCIATFAVQGENK